jgi:F-type H+-transporting ATPase subunit a
MLLGLFTSAIQALVFATLAGAYIHEAIEGHGEEHHEEHS